MVKNSCLETVYDTSLVIEKFTREVVNTNLQDRLDDQISVINTRTGIFQEIESKVSQGIGMDSGLANVFMPSGDKIIESYDTLRSDVAKLMNEVGECEYKHLRSDFQSIEGMLTNVLQLIHRQSQKENVRITAYQAQSLSTVPEYYKLGEASSSTNTKIEEIKKESIDYSELNAIYWNRTDDYFSENWTDNREKFEEALEIIKLETIQCGGLDLFGQVTQLGYGPDNHRLQALIKLSQINQASMSKDVVITEAEKEKDWKDNALGYLLDSGEQILLGNFTDEVTLLGTAGELLLGLVGVDILCDIRDIGYDLFHFELSWKWLGSLAIDLISVVPLIGVLKYFDEVSTLTKRWLKNSNMKIDISPDLVKSNLKKLKKFLDSKTSKILSKKELNISNIKDSKGTKKANEILEGLCEKIFKGGSKTDDLILKGTDYTEEYAKKLKETYKIFKENGYEVSEHGLNRILGRINQGKIDSIDEVVEVMKTGTKYNDTVNGGIVIYKNGISIHVADDGFVKTVIGNAKIKSTWEVIE